MGRSPVDNFVDMKWYILSLFILNCACSQDTDIDGTGIVKGRAQDREGAPLAGVTILVDNSIFFNSHLSTKTDGQGRYTLAVPTGSWYAFAQLHKTYHGRQYKLYLQPDNPIGFGGEGAERNFTWQLTGERPEPLSGYYGGLVTIDNFPGVYLEREEIVFRFAPEGELIDGSSGEMLIRKALDGHQIQDIPIGRYTLTAHYGGEQLKLRRWNSNETFQESLTFDFEPQIAGQCDNCFMLEYNQ